jgi:hypothetical protein
MENHVVASGLGSCTKGGPVLLLKVADYIEPAVLVFIDWIESLPTVTIYQRRYVEPP